MATINITGITLSIRISMASITAIAFTIIVSTIMICLFSRTPAGRYFRFVEITRHACALPSGP